MIAKLGKFTWLALPPLELRGVGTPRVESLEHYVIRQAWTVGITMAQMLSVIGPNRMEPGRAQVMGSGKYCGPSRDFSHRITALKGMTGQDDLHCGSFWVLQDVLSFNGVGRDTTRRRWCPTCYRDWDDETSYEPLAWIVDVQAKCDLHMCGLEGRCRRCGAGQPSTTEYGRRKTCHKCGAPLSADGTICTSTPDESWAQLQLASIIQLCATPGQGKVPFSNFVTFVNELVAANTSTRALPNALRAEFYRARKNLTRGRTTIRAIVNLCGLQSISASDLLLNPKEAASAPLLDLWTSFDTLNLPTGKHRQRLEHCARCLSDILKATKKDHYIPQMKHPLRRFRLNRQLLREMHLDVYEEYESRYQQQGPYSKRVHANRAMTLAISMVEAAAAGVTPIPRNRSALDLIVERCNVTWTVAQSVLFGARNFVNSMSVNRLRRKPAVQAEQADQGEAGC